MLSIKEFKYFSFIITDEDGNQLTPYDYPSLNGATEHADELGIINYKVLCIGGYNSNEVKTK